MLTRNARHPGIVPRQPPLPPRPEIATVAEIMHIEFVERPPAPPKSSQSPKKRYGIQAPNKLAAKALDQIIGEPATKQVKKPAKKKRARAAKRTAAQIRARKPRRYDGFGEWQYMTTAEGFVMARHPNGTVAAMSARRWYAMSRTPVPTLAGAVAKAARDLAQAFERRVGAVKMEMSK